ncbi:sulfotransferase family 2 domain-containing protein [uncultured Tateyamaria sp.]|uniref:sulfotransferase family 2 domain-containing protein n=1 Tax=Tateyamaria sp. 1078 TaxID=3417464 RepID=UPI002624A0CD|nr:sulfotransferase family 2 domain-containing protein [uncultured Tateyamaria sp.]
MARKAPFRERLSRRSAILRGRTGRSLPGRGPNHPSLFFHLPKCGGTSLSEAMYATVPFNQRIGVIDAVATRRAASILHFNEDDPQKCHEDRDTGQLTFDLREGALLQHMAWDTMLIHGHVFWSDRAWQHFGQRYKYVTIMRDPVARMISNFRMTQRSGIVTDDLDTYLQGPIARRHAQVYLRYLVGRNDIDDDALPAALEQARARLKNFALIGFLDRTEAFLAAYRDLFGVPLRMPTLNTAPGETPDLTPSQKSAIDTLCAPDITLFEDARALFL